MSDQEVSFPSSQVIDKSKELESKGIVITGGDPHWTDATDVTVGKMIEVKLRFPNHDMMAFVYVCMDVEGKGTCASLNDFYLKVFTLAESFIR